MDLFKEGRRIQHSEEEVAAFDNTFGAKLPATYKRFLTETGTGALHPNSLKVPGNCTNIRYFLNPQQVCEDNAIIGRWLPDNCIPVAECEMGDYLILKLRGEGPIYFWMHDVEGPDATLFLADNIQELISKIEPDFYPEWTDDEWLDIFARRLKKIDPKNREWYIQEFERQWQESRQRKKG